MSDSTAISRQASLMEVNFRIRNQVLINSNFKQDQAKISWWEMLVKYRWIWCWLSWQISRLTFTCKQVKFVLCIYTTWLLYKFSVLLCQINYFDLEFEAGIPSMRNWFQNQSPTHTFAVDWDTWHVNWVAPCQFNGGLANRKSSVTLRPLSAAPASLWRTLLFNANVTPKYR